MKLENAATATGAGEAARPSDATLDKNGRAPGKFSKKRLKLTKTEVREWNAVLNEKHPEDHPLVAGVPDDIMDKLGLVAGDDEKAVRAAQRGHKQAAYIVRTARSARAELEELLLKGVVPALLRLALVEKGSAAKHWAGMILASIGISIEKYDKKLCEINAGYREEKNKIRREKQLAHVLFPKPVMETVQRELQKAEDHRRTLRRLKEVCGRTWRKSCQGISEVYFPFMKLAEFSLESEGLWWKCLWPLIKKNNPGLLTTLREGKIPTRGIRYHGRWASYRNEFHNALRTLARLRSAGVR
jgi:hypothetical protein